MRIKYHLDWLRHLNETELYYGFHAFPYNPFNMLSTEDPEPLQENESVKELLEPAALSPEQEIIVPAEVDEMAAPEQEQTITDSASDQAPVDIPIESEQLDENGEPLKRVVEEEPCEILSAENLAENIAQHEQQEQQYQRLEKIRKEEIKLSLIDKSKVSPSYYTNSIKETLVLTYMYLSI